RRSCQVPATISAAAAMAATAASIISSERPASLRTSGSRRVRRTSSRTYSQVTSPNRSSRKASKRRTAEDCGRRLKMPRTIRLVSTTALTCGGLGTSNSADGSIHDPVDLALVLLSDLVTNLLDEQPESQLGRQELLDQRRLIRRR